MFIKEANNFDSSDLVIIGAGPAGLTASLYAQRLGIQHVLIEKKCFPKDKICGDAIPPLVFNLLDELGVKINYSESFQKIEEIEFKFSDRNSHASFRNNYPIKSRIYNCKRILFDELLKSAANPERIILAAEMLKIEPENNSIVISINKKERPLRYKNLMLCTGSGRNLLFKTEGLQNLNITFASRAYIEAVNAGRRNFVEFFDEISPGYFWAFPVTPQSFNTGIYFHDRKFVPDLYKLHKQKLHQYFQIKNPVRFNRWPLKIQPNNEINIYENIAVCGDANHSIDPLLGHGIDVAMLEAREHVIALKQTGNFTQKSNLFQEIQKRGNVAWRYKEILSLNSTAEEKKGAFIEFLQETKTFYAAVNECIGLNQVSGHNTEVKNTALKNPDQLRLSNLLREDGYSVVDLLNEKEFSNLSHLLNQFQFGFTNNRNREKLKFNSSFFESDTELKTRYYQKMVHFFQPKLDLILDNYDVLITNLWEKKPGDDEVLVHQNWSHVDEKYFRSYSIWIPLQNTSEINGTMQVIPGSHKLFTPLRGINMEHPFSSQFKAIGKEIKKEFLVPVPLKQGQAIIFDDALLHYTGPNTSPEPRLAIQLIVKPKSAKGLFYYKHKEIARGNNVEVFEADSDFYIKLKLVTGGNTRPEHGVSKGFISHISKETSMQDFRNIIKSGNKIDIEDIVTFPERNFVEKVSDRVKSILNRF